MTECSCYFIEGPSYCDPHHIYRRDGIVLPSVTRILDELLPRTDSAPEDAIANAGLRGSWVDAALAQYLTTGNVDVPEAVPDEYKTCLELAVRWWEQNRARSKVQTQVRLFGDREAGTLDLLVDDFEILDLKSTYKIDVKRVTCQLGGYGDLLAYQQYANKYPDEWRDPPFTYGVLHVVKRLKNAQFKPIEAKEAFRSWRILRDYYRFREAA